MGSWREALLCARTFGLDLVGCGISPLSKPWREGWGCPWGERH